MKRDDELDSQSVIVVLHAGAVVLIFIGNSDELKAVDAKSSANLRQVPSARDRSPVRCPTNQGAVELVRGLVRA